MELPRTPSFRLDGKRALVTGASSGIGLGAAVALAEAGAHVVCAARGAERLNAAVDEMKAVGFSAEARALDVADLDAQRALFANGPFDVVVNAAGLARHGPALDTDPADYDAVMAVNLRGAYFLSQQAARAMQAAGRGGSIIHISSQMAHVGGIDRAVYCASKHGLEGLVTKAMAIEWGKAGIRVNTICPTFIRTPLTESDLRQPRPRAVDRGEDQAWPRRRRSRISWARWSSGLTCLGVGDGHRAVGRWWLDGGMMERSKVTSAEVAARAGVSQSAVSRVFTPGASASRRTVEKVRAAAAELGYRPNVLARAMVSGKSRIIGLVVAYLDNQFYPLALELLSNALQARGYHILIFTATNSIDDADAVVEEMMDYQVDGIITASVSISSTLAGRAKAAEIPVVLFNRGQDDGGLSLSPRPI